VFILMCNRGWVLDPAQIEILRGIRDVFDPHRILNPGKIFP
jgi:FAD/FMN-containing dehydrogenase